MSPMYAFPRGNEVIDQDLVGSDLSDRQPKGLPYICSHKIFYIGIEVAKVQAKKRPHREGAWRNPINGRK